MSRELSEEEIALVDRANAYREATKEIRDTSPLPIFMRPSFWGALLAIIPAIATFLILAVGNQFQQIATSEAAPLVSLSYGDFDEFIPLFESRFLIIGGMWSVYVLIMALLIGIEVLIRRKRNASN